MIKCWNCKSDIEKIDLFCGACGSISAPTNLSHFERFKLEQSYNIDESELDKIYIQLARKLHPDLFVRKSEQEQRFSMSHIVDLNDSYEILKSSLKRSEYLLALNGFIVNKDGASSVKPSQKLLMESLMAREEIEESETLQDIQNVIDKANSEKVRTIDSITKNFIEKNYEDAAQNTIRLKYLEKLIEEAKIKSKNL